MCFRISKIKSTLASLIGMSKRIRSDMEQHSANGVSFCSDVCVEPTKKVHTSCSLQAYTHLVPPVKSFSDKKEYSVIKLKNGLTALIISDKSQILNIDEIRQSSESKSIDSEGSEQESLLEQGVEYSGSDTGGSESEDSSDEDDGTKQNKYSNDGDVNKASSNEEKLAACALCIGVGSFSDPEHIQGLAHFLEHMIFMGSEKYPKENEFDVFIKKKGGSDNASTECEFTTYYFDCHEAHLPGAMDIFSQLFISPLMKKDTMTKEREAIESEFQMAIPSDESRRSQILCSLANKDNPAHKFMWGNLITLRDNIKDDDDLYKAVHAFRMRHYSAHRMNLAVQARLPVETLEKWVNECFKDVPFNQLPREGFDLTVPPFKTEEFCKLYIIEPVKDVNHIHLTWVLPTTLHMYKTKPLNYLGWIIGHEGEGSLLSHLRNKLWSFNVTVSAGGDGTEENSIYTLFSISIVVTEEGVGHIEEILKCVFEYITMLRNHGPQERIFREIQLVAETSFKFSEEVSSADNVEQLSENMHFFPSVDYITGTELYFEYGPDLIRSLLGDLKADNVNIMISSKTLASSEILDKIEPWFGTKYKVKNIPNDWINNWRDSKVNEDFHLPHPNPFIASNFNILPAPQNLDDYPKVIAKDDNFELWFKQDVTFKLPHAFCCLHLVSPLSRSTAKNAAILDLFISVLKLSLAEKLYPANVAQLEYGFHMSEKGISIAINGFNDKLKILLQEIITGVKSIVNDRRKDLFKTVKEELKKSYANANLKTGFLAREIRMSILVDTYWTYTDKEKSLKDVTFEEMKDLIAEYFKHLYIQCLIQGNVSMDEALEYTEVIKTGFSNCIPLLPNTAPEIRIKQLPLGERVCVVKSFNPQDANSVVTNYYQSSLGSIHECCIIELLLMIMEEPLFDSLRTKQQLGYDVSCSLRDTYGVLGFSISVHCQSDRNSVDLVQDRITQFLQDFLEIIRSTTIEDFEEVQESLLKLKLCADIHLKEEVKRNWDEIKMEEYVFDRHHKEIECIKKLTLSDLIEWFSSVSGVKDQSKSKKLSIQVVGQVKSNKGQSESPEISGKNEFNDTVKELSFVHQQETSDKFITNISDFKDTLITFPVHKIIN